ncbi:MAG: hypothetical protein QOD87_1026, partial [Pseudonocardiales bacterium]|nr:hypothetical protein [Pseudonocardiales bacterium]
AIPALEQLGVEEKRIYFDKFTTTGSSDPAPVTGRATP